MYRIIGERPRLGQTLHYPLPQPHLCLQISHQQWRIWHIFNEEIVGVEATVRSVICKR